MRRSANCESVENFGVLIAEYLLLHVLYGLLHRTYFGFNFDQTCITRVSEDQRS